jgi:hypothetical protein
MRTGRSTSCRAALGLAVALVCAALVPASPSTPGSGWPAQIEPAAEQVTAGMEEGDKDQATQTPGPMESPTSAGSPEPERPSASAGQPSSITQPPHGSPALGGIPRTGVSVRAGNAVLTSRYWSGERTASLTVTVTNLGNVAETVTLRNVPPAGVQTASCPARCAPHVPPGKSRRLIIGLLVDPGAWQSSPLGGRLNFTATAPGAATLSGRVAWGVVFPPGPPTPGLTLRASDVHLDVAGERPVVRGHLTVQVTNSGKAPGTGEVAVVAPAGVTFGALPAACLPRGPSAIACDTGVLAVGKSWEVLLTLLIPAVLRADTSMVGLVRAKLSTYGQSALLTQSSYQILAARGQSGAPAGTSAEPAAPGAATRQPARPVPVRPIIGGSVALLIVVAVGLAMTLSWRREAGPAQRPARDKAAARQPGAGEAAADRQEDATAMLSAGPVDRTPTPRGPIRWEWIADEQSTEPPSVLGPPRRTRADQEHSPPAKAGPAAGDGRGHDSQDVGPVAP